MKKIISLAIALAILASCCVIAVSATTLSFSVRIEGIEKNLYDKTLTISTDDDDPIDYSLGEALSYINENEDSITIEGIENGYITSVNGETAGKFGGYDGWYYSVNGETPDVGINDYKLKDSDVVVLYYGDYPCQVPKLDLTDVEDGAIKVVSYDSVWYQDENEEWKSTSDWAPVIGAELDLNGLKCQTDENGVAHFNRSSFKASDTVYVQISKYSDKGCPQVLRFAPGYNFGLGDVPGETKAPTETSTNETGVPSTESATVEPTAPATESATVEPTAPATESATVEPTAPATESATVEPTAPVTEPVTETQPASESKDTTISVPAKKSLYRGQTYKINAKITNPVGNTSYISNRKSIASVNKSGKVTARKKGTAVITVKNNGVSKTFKITVKNPKLNKKKITLTKGKTFKIKITGKAGKQSYKSSKKSVAKVSKTGKVTAKKRGNAVITVTTNSGYKLKLKVKVK